MSHCVYLYSCRMLRSSSRSSSRSSYWTNAKQNKDITHLFQHKAVSVNEMAWIESVQHFSASGFFCAFAHLSDSLIVLKNDCFVYVFTLLMFFVIIICVDGIGINPAQTAGRCLYFTRSGLPSAAASGCNKCHFVSSFDISKYHTGQEIFCLCKCMLVCLFVGGALIHLPNFF